MNAEREVIDIGTLATQIKDTDLRVGNTTIETRFRIWLGRD